MNIEFSDKYQSLFDLLEAKKIVEAKGFNLEPLEHIKYWTDLSKVDTVLMSGGRDSGKSFALSCFNPIAAKEYNHRILYTRQTMSSTDNSITEALEQRMLDLNLAQYFESANKTYTLKDKEVSKDEKYIGKISITGQKTSVGTQTAKLKSLEGFSIFETDEGEELESYDSWKKIKRSIRARDVQALSIIVFNPPSKAHWLNDAFYIGIPDGFNGVKDNVLYIHTTYLDNGKDNMALHNWNEYEQLRVDYELYLSTSKELRLGLSKKIRVNYDEYRYAVLGGFREVAEGVIFTDWKIGDFNIHLPYCYGLDFGFSDPDAMIKVCVDEHTKTVYLDEVMYKNNSGNTQLITMVKSRIHNPSDLIVADPNESRMLNDLYYDGGLNVIKAKKPKGSVSQRYNKLLGYQVVVTERSYNLILELNNHTWHDKISGLPSKDKWHHCLDSAMYGLGELYNQ